ncbi:MAG: PD40 domain-containing protein [Chloroflexi bacterium]|nr:PD40 domain-containing protein [Chloroflexota bacterium]
MNFPPLGFRIGTLFIFIILALGTACFGDSSQNIVFVTSVGGDSEVYSLDPATGESVALTDNQSRDFDPRWSPDGKQVVFLSDESGDVEINLVDRAGEVVVRLTHSAGDDTSPRWSPDGQRIAFISHRDNQPEIYLMAADGSNPTRVTNNSTDDRLGDWSPDGVWLVFYSVGDETERGLWLRNPDGVDQFHVTNGDDRDPVWSPDDRHIAFVRNEGGNKDIYIVSRMKNGVWQDIIEPTRLTQHETADLSPTWSPDGKTLAFVSYRDGNAEIYTMRPDGSRQTRLTSNEVDDLSPTWSKDGKRIAFVSHLYGTGEIFAMNIDGTSQQRLTSNTVEDSFPDW